MGKNKGQSTSTLLGIAAVVIALAALIIWLGPRILEMIKLAPGISEAGENSCELNGGKCVGNNECQTRKLDWSCPRERPECCL